LYIPRKEASLLWRRVLGTLSVEWLAVGVSQEFGKHYEERGRLYFHSDCGEVEVEYRKE
jgi:hypothetical protein